MFLSVCLCPALLLAVREEKNQWALSAPEDQRQPPIAHRTSLTQAPAHSLLVTSQKAYSSESRAIKNAALHICVPFMPRE